MEICEIPEILYRKLQKEHRKVKVMKIDFGKVIDAVEKVENEYETLAKKGLTKKEIVIEALNTVIDIPLIPEFAEAKILGLVIDAIVAAFNRVGHFVHKTT